MYVRIEDLLIQIMSPLITNFLKDSNERRKYFQDQERRYLIESDHYDQELMEKERRSIIIVALLRISYEKIEILMTERTIADNLLQLPAGYLLQDENLIEGALRKVREETGFPKTHLLHHIYAPEAVASHSNDSRILIASPLIFFTTSRFNDFYINENEPIANPQWIDLRDFLFGANYHNDRFYPPNLRMFQKKKLKNVFSKALINLKDYLMLKRSLTPYELNALIRLKSHSNFNELES